MPLAWFPCLSSSKHHVTCMWKGRRELIKLTTRTCSYFAQISHKFRTNYSTCRPVFPSRLRRTSGSKPQLGIPTQSAPVPLVLTAKKRCEWLKFARLKFARHRTRPMTILARRHTKRKSSKSFARFSIVCSRTIREKLEGALRPAPWRVQ